MLKRDIVALLVSTRDGLFEREQRVLATPETKLERAQVERRERDRASGYAPIEVVVESLERRRIVVEAQTIEIAEVVGVDERGVVANELVDFVLELERAQRVVLVVFEEESLLSHKVLG